MRGMNIPLPKALSTPVEFIINNDLCKLIRQDKTDLRQLNKLVNEAARLSLKLDESTIRFEASHKINRLMSNLLVSSFGDSPDTVELLETIEKTIRMLRTIVSEMDLQTAQNVFFTISKGNYPDMKRKAAAGDQTAKKWVDLFRNLAQHLDVKIE
jgi:hypothetical protein